ncbi:MAG: hypothetical protein HFH46_00225 [Bacilli bacterium]|nr:hypothetical protein [Bacilli bacterium]
MQERNQWIDIITKMYQDLHTSGRVMHVSKESDKKRDRIINYFDRLEEVHKKVIQAKSESALKMLKQFYYDLYIIKPENIPETYFENEQRIMRERGYGDIELTEERKNILIDQIIEDQKASLEPWIEYFLFDEESESYEMWERYWAFQGLQKLGKYDKEKQKFSKRDKTTVYPFPPVERQAIFTTIHLMEEYIKNKKAEEEIKSALGEGNFKTLYEYSIRQIMQKGEKKNPRTNEGKWIKYEQGSDYNILRNSLQGYYTGWCTAAGENFAKSQLQNGDFYVYYTLDENNEPKVPRIAIRMEGHNTIGEIRGIANDQNMEPEMMPILNEKLKEFPDRDKYYKKEYDMQRLTTIDNKVKKGFELDKEDLKFLYEIEDKIEGFGYGKDPRIEEIKSQRNLKKDFANIYNCKEEEIGTCIEDLNNPNIKVYVGDLNLSYLTNAKGLVLPQIINGNLYLNRLTSAEGLVLPQIINGNLYLNSLTSAEGLVLPQIINGNLHLSGLTSAKGLDLPETLNGYLDLRRLTSAEELILPQIINGNLYLSGLTSAEGLILPKTLNGGLSLDGLTSAEGLVLPETLNGGLSLDSLTSAKGLVLPKTINGYLSLDSLTSAEGLVLPHNFPLELLLCSWEIKNEILNNPEKYYKNVKIEEKVSENTSEITLPRYR